MDNDGNGILDDEGDPLNGFNLMQYQEAGSILTSPQGGRMRDQALECVPDTTLADAPPASGSLGTDPLGDAGTPEGTYSGMVRHNVETIVEALK